MTEKIGLIKNPLTIIAIFAGIAEVSGTIVLPFIAQANQPIFIYFLISFPSVLVFLFFVTLNFNNKVLYAPSDYQDESNYISINRYDVAKQQNVEFKVSKDDTKSQQLIQLSEKVELISTQVIKLETAVNNKGEVIVNEANVVEDINYELLVSNFDNVDRFIQHMKKIGVRFEVYYSPDESFEVSSLAEHRAIWLGKDVSLKDAQIIIREAKYFYPHLKYIKISDDFFDENMQIYIGGSTESAVKKFNRAVMTDSDFKSLSNFDSIDDFHKFIENFKRQPS